ncbi:MAG: tRNA pseudouridine(55) synthase TruB [Clostridia bacterium]|nr:tRNA pseudouridine(55) synthase TruB [Clostridia bacterium]
MKSGVIIIDKEEGITSQGAVNRIKRLFGCKKAGHTGTLDPLATGVLPILIGRAVKASDFLLTGDKHYGAIMLLGTETDTEDITGKVLSVSDFIPDEKEVMSAVNSMLGASKQIPPMYSAIKIDGKKLYDLAREGKTVEREARPIFIHEIKCERLSEKEYKLDIKCSKGTYIRTVCADIGKKLGCGATMKTLRRLSAAGFEIGEAHTLTEIENMSEEEREKLITPTEKIFENLKKITLPPFFSRLARCGVEIYLKKIGVSLEIGETVALYDGDVFFAVGEVREFEAGAAIKPIRQFDID